MTHTNSGYIDPRWGTAPSTLHMPKGTHPYATDWHRDQYQPVQSVDPDTVTAFSEAIRELLKRARADYTSRFYKKALKLARCGRFYGARKAAIRSGVPAIDIDATMTLLGI